MHGQQNVKININSRKNVRNFAKCVVYNLSFCMLIICSAVCFESFMVRLIVIERDE